MQSVIGAKVCVLLGAYDNTMILESLLRRVHRQLTDRVFLDSITLGRVIIPTCHAAGWWTLRCQLHEADKWKYWEREFRFICFPVNININVLIT